MFPATEWPGWTIPVLVSALKIFIDLLGNSTDKTCIRWRIYVVRMKPFIIIAIYLMSNFTSCILTQRAKSIYLMWNSVHLLRCYNVSCTCEMLLTWRILARFYPIHWYILCDQLAFFSMAKGSKRDNFNQLQDNWEALGRTCGFHREK